MATVTRTTTWSDNQVLTASALNGEFNNLLNALALTNSDISAGAAIAYSKLNLTGSIVTADINAIAESKVTFNTSTGHSHNGSDSKLIQINRAFAWFIAGTLAADSTNRLYARYVAPESLTIKKIWGAIETAPTGANLLVDIHKNGTTIWSTQGNRLAIVASATSGNQTTFDTTAIASGDILDIYIDQVGASVAGSDIAVTLECTQP